jgi:hypothetical protein
MNAMYQAGVARMGQNLWEKNALNDVHGDLGGPMVVAHERTQQASFAGRQLDRYDLSFAVPVAFFPGGRPCQRAHPQVVGLVLLARDLGNHFYLVALTEPADQLVRVELAPANGGPIRRQNIADLHALDFL